MSTKQNKLKTVSDKITESFLPQADQDPEDDPENLARIADFDDDEADEIFDRHLGPSEIRKRNVKLLSEFSDKYKGKVTSRKELQTESDGPDDDVDDLSDESDSDAESEINAFKSQRKADIVKSNEKDDSSVDFEESDAENSDYADEESEAGKKSRKQVESEKDLDYEDSSEGDDNDNDEDDNDDDEDDNDDDGNGTDEIEDSDYDSSRENQDVLDESSSKIFPETNQNAEVQKGLAVQNQLKIWEKLLEVRIHSQKMLTKANSFPPPNIYNGLCQQSNDFKKLAQDATTNLSKLLDSMLDMQHILADQFQEMAGIIKSGKKRLSSAGKAIAEPEIKRFASALTANFEAFKPYRNSVLQKWDDRTKILAAGAGSKKGGKALADNFDIVRKIDTALLNKRELINKARTVKGNYKLFGTKEERQDQSASNEIRTGDDEEVEGQKQSSNEIYDDTDFYHQQLRELIEYKSNISSNPAEMSKQFAELQKLRQKMKKKVDTRASKGRKIRYVVHNKLVNFMAPDSNCAWTEESKIELYRSLFAT